MSDPCSKVSPKTVQFEDNEASRHLTMFLGEIKQRQHYHVGTQLSAGHQSSGSLDEEKEEKKDANTPTWGGGLSVKGANCDWSRIREPGCGRPTSLHPLP